MRMTMRLSILFVGALVGSVYACKSQTVVTPPSCSEPCCGGNLTLVNCGENPDISCTESSDPCMPLAFGCMGGLFFKMPLPAPASCTATEGASDGTTVESDATTGTFGTDDGGQDAATEGASEAATEGGPDAMIDAATDATGGGSEAATEAGPDAMTDALTEAAPDGAP